MYSLRGLDGLDAWLTREPVERRFEEELVWRVDGYTPHADKPIEIGEFDREEDAYHATNNWLRRAFYDAPEWAQDYWVNVHEHDLLADCTCWGKIDKWCPIHGIDPDQAYDERMDR